MSFLDIFGGGASGASQDQINSINAGLGLASQFTNMGNSVLSQNYMKGLAPFLQNYGTATQGVGQLGNVLGLNGPAGNQSALSTLQSTPGYQFQLQQGDNSVNAAAAANGMLGSGNQQTALANYNQGLAGTTYNNYVNQLQPYLGYSTSSAGGIGSLYSGLGNQLNANYQNLGNEFLQGMSGIGASQANANLANSKGFNNFLGAGLSGLAGIFSDERLKENIEPVGKLFDETNVYRYNYKGDDTPRIGVMAQEVERTRPDAVVIHPSGFKMVDYGRATDYAAGLSHFFKEAA